MEKENLHTKYSVLEKNIKMSDRPYSQKELSTIRYSNRKRLFLSSTKIEHPECGHFYYVKKNSRKEYKIKTKGIVDVGNCSICWKLRYRNTQEENMLVYTYCTDYFKDCEYLKILQLIKKKKIFKKKHVVIIHRERKSLEKFKNLLKIIDTKRYGRSKIIFGKFN